MSPEENSAKKTRDSSSEAVSPASDARNGPGTVGPILPYAGRSKAEDFRAIKSALSPERFESYRQAPDDPEEVIFRRYQWNAEVSECFYAALTAMEVVMRNGMDSAITANFNNPQWLLTVPGWLLNDERASIQEAADYLGGRDREVTQGRMVQEMSFGFWTRLLSRKYETLFRGIGVRAFPGMPREMRSRENASRRFESIRKLRNRIFHFRRIWNRANLLAEFDGILEGIDWVNPKARVLLLPDSCRVRFLTTLARKP